MKMLTPKITVFQFTSKDLPTKVPAQSLSAAELASRKIAAIQGTWFAWKKRSN